MDGAVPVTNMLPLSLAVVLLLILAGIAIYSGLIASAEKPGDETEGSPPDFEPRRINRRLADLRANYVAEVRRHPRHERHHRTALAAARREVEEMAWFRHAAGSKP